jgi:hypothetical protein
MANHKRGRRKSIRAGCLWCKPHKAEGTKKMTSAQTLQERRAREAERLDVEPDDEVTGIICRAWQSCPHPGLCQTECWDADLVVGLVGGRSEEKDEPPSGDGTTT